MLLGTGWVVWVDENDFDFFTSSLGVCNTLGVCLKQDVGAGSGGVH